MAQLIVEPADGVPRGPRAVLLHELDVETGGFAEDALVVALVGEAARIFVDLRLEQQHFGEVGRYDPHR